MMARASVRVAAVGIALGLCGAARGHAQGGAGAPEALVGDATRDLVFTPVERCRVIDTRVAGGRLVAGVPRHFDVAGPLVGQGGAADCLVPYGPATVVVLNLVAVQPLGAGTVTAWPFGGAIPTANVIHYQGRRVRQETGNAPNEVSLPICDPGASSCTFDLTLEASGADTHLVADVAGYYSALTGLTVDWSDLEGIPPGFADGIDADTHYSAGAGLTQTGTTFSVDTSAVQARVGQACPAGSAVRTIQANGAVVCESDDNTTYAAGAGLSLAGTTFSVANLGVTGPMLAAGSVGTGKIAANTVTGAEIVDRSVDTAEIALGAITNSELSSFAVGFNKIASGVVGQSEIATDGVGATEIAANAVGAAEIAASAVGRSEIDGAEVAVYRMRPACGSDDITLSATCTTPLCTPVPIPLFWDCSRNCDSLAPMTCDNTLLGYLLSPNID